MQYPSFIYLQNHKTGCSFVEAYLRQFCAEPLLSYQKHKALSAPPAVFCFTNVREPLALYRSLFAYGLDGRGQVWQRINTAGYQGLYEAGSQGFAGWLDFVMTPCNAPFLDDAFTPTVAKFMGFATWRFLRLACPGFDAIAPSLTHIAELSTQIAPLYGLGAVLKQEQLRDGLLTLTRTRLANCIPDQRSAIAWLSKAEKVNVSFAKAADAPVSEALVSLVQQQDALIYQNFYPESMTTLGAKKCE